MSGTSAVGTFTAWDYLVFALMLLISGLIGIFYAVKAKGQETSMDFLMGNRQMSALPVALSLTASFMSAVTVLGSPFEVYRFGAIFSLFTLSHLFTMLITSEIFLPVFYRLGIASTYEYLELRFNRCVRLCGTILFMIQTILYTGIVIYAPALALNQVTKFHLWGAVISTGIVCTFYCTLGGLKAVVWTDVFQIGIMVAGFIAVIIRAMVLEGGIGNVWDAAYYGGRLNFWNFDPNPMRRHTFWTIVIGGTFVWTGIYGVNQAQVQRYMSCKSRFQAKVSLYVNLIGLWVIMTCAVLSGLSMYSIYRDCDPWTAGKVKAPDQLMPYLVLDIFEGYPGLPGLFVACAYSGTLSTVSSSINALATVTVEDIIKPIFNPLSEKQLYWISKGMTLLYGLLCIGMAGLASLMESLLQSAISIFGIVGGPLVGLFTLGILFSCANSAGGIVGLITGLAFAMWIGIGSQIHPPTPETTMPLLLSVAGCNFSKPINETSWITETSRTTVPGTTINHRFETVDTWHSLSYLYISPFASLIVIMVGLIVSLLTGGRKAHVNPHLLLCWTDLSCYFPRNSSGDDIIQVTEWRQGAEPITGNNNAGFSNIEMSCTGKGKM